MNMQQATEQIDKIKENLCYNCELLYCDDSNLMCNEAEALEKAKSDMYKLHKIEALYGIDKFGKVLTREERDMEVQKILEES